MIPIKLSKKFFFSCIYKNVVFGYKDSYNYYGIDVDKIVLFVKSDNEYIIRCNDVNKKKLCHCN